MMTLYQALALLARVHTGDDEVTGFVVRVGAPFPELCSQQEYLDAWEAIRAFLNRDSWQTSQYLDRRLPSDRRHLRAMQLVGHAMHFIGPLIEDRHGHDTAKQTANILLDLFMAIGIEIVTDAMRSEAGLPPRGPMGWTREELAALEARRLEVMTKPVMMVIPEKHD